MSQHFLRELRTLYSSISISDFGDIGILNQIDSQLLRILELPLSLANISPLVPQYEPFDDVFHRFVKFSFLRRLSLERVVFPRSEWEDIVSDNPNASSMSLLPHLQELDVLDCYIYSLEKIIRLSTLQYLKIYWTHFSESYRTVFRAHLTQLTLLETFEMDIECNFPFDFLLRNPKLRSLSLGAPFASFFDYLTS